MGEKLNFLILGNSHSAELFAEGLISTGCSCVAAVSLAKDLLPDNSEGLKSWSEKSSIRYREIRSVNDKEFIKIVVSTEPDLLIVTGRKS